MQAFTKYPEAKIFFTRLSGEGVWGATAMLGSYQNLKNTKGELVAARFLLDAYLLYKNYTRKEYKNG